MINTIIAKTNGNNKVIDFRDNLHLSNVEDYAQLHGMGGKNHAIKSCIKCFICDFSKGIGDKSQTASINLDIDLIYRLKMLSEQYLNDTSSYTMSPAGVSALKEIVTTIKKVKASEDNVNTKMIDWISNKVNEIGKSLARTHDFSYQSGKVDIYKKNNGIAPVSILSISHSPFYNGKPSKYPWYIKITNGTAPYTEQEGGTVTYNAKDLKKDKEVFINVSDSDMYRMMQRITRYIEIWEQSNCIPNVIEALQKREEERISAINNKE